MDEQQIEVEIEGGWPIEGKEAPAYLEIGLKNFDVLLVSLKDILEMKVDGVAESHRIREGSGFMEIGKHCQSFFLKLSKRCQDIYEKLRLKGDVEDIAYLNESKYLTERICLPWEGETKGGNACCKVYKDEEGNIIIDVKRR